MGVTHFFQFLNIQPWHGIVDIFSSDPHDQYEWQVFENETYRYVVTCTGLLSTSLCPWDLRLYFNFIPFMSYRWLIQWNIGYFVFFILLRQASTHIWDCIVCGESTTSPFIDCWWAVVLEFLLESFKPCFFADWGRGLRITTCQVSSVRKARECNTQEVRKSSQVQSLLAVPFLLKLFCFQLKTLPTFCIYEKTRLSHLTWFN